MNDHGITKSKKAKRSGGEMKGQKRWNIPLIGLAIMLLACMGFVGNKVKRIVAGANSGLIITPTGGRGIVTIKTNPTEIAAGLSNSFITAIQDGDNISSVQTGGVVTITGTGGGSGAGGESGAWTNENGEMSALFTPDDFVIDPTNNVTITAAVFRVRATNSTTDGIVLDSDSGIDVDASNRIDIASAHNAAEAIRLRATDPAGNIHLDSSGTGPTAIDIDSAGAIDIDAIDDVDIASSAGNIGFFPLAGTIIMGADVDMGGNSLINLGGGSITFSNGPGLISRLTSDGTNFSYVTSASVTSPIPTTVGSQTFDSSSTNDYTNATILVNGQAGFEAVNFDTLTNNIDLLGGGGGNGIALTGKWTAVKSVEWMGWQQGIGSTASNAIVPLPFVINNASNSIAVEGFHSTLIDMQDIFAYAICTWPPYATNWADTAIVIRVIGDATGITTNFLDLVFMDGIQSFTTNNLVPNSSTAFREYVILKTELPTSWTNFPIMTLHSNMIVRGDFHTSRSNTLAAEIDFNLK